MTPHLFVAIPFGIKEWIDFNRNLRDGSSIGRWK